jgi:diguanylate cyclase (GGDEF)-like protein
MELTMQTWLAHFKVRPKLLVVDDQRINILVLNELFREDCDVFMATSGEQALQVCRAQLPDLVLLDVQMDGIDGYEVCRRLKADAESRNIPVIFITAQGGEADEVRGLQLGAVDFIAKPINPVIVRARVQTHLTLKLQSDILRSMALLDGLTGVANRRKFDEQLLRDWRQSQREQTSLSLILVDVDHFKRYNDHYGHQAGDAALQAVARVLTSTLRRPHDLLARYGGEEFVGVLPNTGLSEAVKLAERMQAGVRALNLEHSGSPEAQVVTISLGVATVVARSDLAPQALVEAADQQLYAAKQAGRARVCAAALTTI